MDQQVQDIINEIKKVIVGKDDIIAKVFMAMLSGGHILLDDVPGVGKTTLALSFSKALGLDYKRVQLTSDSMPSDIVGFSVYDKESGNMEYKPGAVMTNLFLGLSTGANVLCAHFMGARDERNLSKTVHTSISLAIISGVFLTIVGVLFADDLLYFMNTPDEVRELSALYLRLYFCGMIAMLVYNFGSSILRSKGDTKRPLYILFLFPYITPLHQLFFRELQFLL